MHTILMNMLWYFSGHGFALLIGINNFDDYLKGQQDFDILIIMVMLKLDQSQRTRHKQLQSGERLGVIQVELRTMILYFPLWEKRYLTLCKLLRDNLSRDLHSNLTFCTKNICRNLGGWLI